MTYKDLIRKTARQAKCTQEVAKAVLDAAIEISKDTLANGEPVKILSFGTISTQVRKARRVSNPMTKGETITIPAHNGITFTPTQELKNRINAEDSINA